MSGRREIKGDEIELLANHDIIGPTINERIVTTYGTALRRGTLYSVPLVNNQIIASGANLPTNFDTVNIISTPTNRSPTESIVPTMVISAGSNLRLSGTGGVPWAGIITVQLQVKAVSDPGPTPLPTNADNADYFLRMIIREWNGTGYNTQNKATSFIINRFTKPPDILPQANEHTIFFFMAE